MRRLVPCIILITSVIMTANARRSFSDKFKTTYPAQTSQSGQSNPKGAIKILPSDTVKPGLEPDSISFSGFDKSASSDKESFLITNKCHYTLVRVDIEISYYTPAGLMLDKREKSIGCLIPPAETRKIDIKSFDTQHTYHFQGSPAGRSGASPFVVTFRILALYFAPSHRD